MHPRLILAGQRHRIQRGHAWAYRNEIIDTSGSPQDGEVADLFDRGNRFIARGDFNGGATIAFRALTRRQEEIDESFWKARIQKAAAYRSAMAPARESCRLVHSEADFLPGLIVDRYAGVMVMQTNTLAMDRRKRLLAGILAGLFQPGAVLENNTGSSRQMEKLEISSGPLIGEHAGPVRTRIGRAEFICDPLGAHKTGFYLDQQENYEIVAKYIRPGMRILDGFCNLGGFALHALLAGAGEAVAVESNSGSVELARKAAELTGVEARLKLVAGNMFDYLRAAQKSAEKFDFIVLDPPSFCRTRKSVPEARRGYKEIHLRAFKLLRPGGMLATFCCSYHVSQAVFLEFIMEAARDARAVLRREAVLGAGPDHPVLPALPETEYLKGFVFTVVE